MKIKSFNSVLLFLMLAFTCSGASALSSEVNTQEKKVLYSIKQAKAYLIHHGKDKAIAMFKKNHSAIFAINFNGDVLASPIHPETVGTNQINYKDPFKVFVVREEINKAKAGGGWLKGRYRENPVTGKFECRRLYVLPLKGDYLIGSWYYYAANKKRQCVT